MQGIAVSRGRAVSHYQLHDGIVLAALFHGTNEDDHVILDFAGARTIYAVNREDAISFASVISCKGVLDESIAYGGQVDFFHFPVISATNVYGSSTETTFAITSTEACYVASIYEQSVKVLS